MAKYDNIDVNGKDAFANRTPSYDSIMKQKAKDTKKALHKQKKEDDAEAADKAMQEEVDKEYEAKKEVEKQALENNGSSEEVRDYNKAVQETGEEPKVEEQIEAQVEQKPEVEESKVESKVKETSVLPENVEKELDESDEGQFANEAVNENNPAKLQNLQDADGNPVLKGTYNEDGVYLPHTYTIEDSRLVKNPGMAACLTIVSKAITALGALAGIPIPMIDFMKFGATPEEDLQKLNENEQNYAKILNAGKGEANEIIRTEEAKTNAYESDAQSAIDKPELYESDVQNKVAGSAAALAGGNTQLQTQESQQDWQTVQNELDRQFQKEMKDKDISGQIAILKQNGVNQKELATLMNDLEVQEVFKKAQIAEERGMKPDDLAKWIRGMNGTTTLEAYAPAVSSLLGSALGIVGGAGTAAIQGANMAKQASIINGQNSAQFSNNEMLKRELDAMKAHPERFFTTNKGQMKYAGETPLR